MTKIAKKALKYSILSPLVADDKKKPKELGPTPDELAADADEQEERRRRGMFGRSSTNLTSPLGIGSANTGATLLSGT